MKGCFGCFKEPKITKIASNKVLPLPAPQEPEESLSTRMMNCFVHKVFDIKRIAPAPVGPCVDASSGSVEFDQYINTIVKQIVMKKLPQECHDFWRRGVGIPETDLRLRSVPGYAASNINVSYVNLSPEWQLENIKAAALAFDVVINSDTDSDIEYEARQIHVKWMQRNPKNENNAYNHIPYDTLPENEKEKDRAHVRLARAHRNTLVESVKALFPSCSVERATRHMIVSLEILKNFEHL